MQKGSLLSKDGMNLQIEVLLILNAGLICRFNNESTVGTENIQTPLNFSLFVSLQPFAKIKKVHFISH